LQKKTGQYGYHKYIANSMDLKYKSLAAHLEKANFVKDDSHRGKSCRLA